MNYRKITLIFCLPILLLLSSCQFGPLGLRNHDPTKDPVTKTGLLLGTVITATAYGDNAKEALDLAFEKVDEINHKMSRYEPGSQVDLINQNAGSEAINISPDTFFVIEKALDYAKKTKGAFNPVIGEIVDLWGIGTDTEKVPTKEELNQFLSHLDYNYLELTKGSNEAELKAKLTSDKVKLDLGAIAKGYAADVMRDVLLEEGITSALLNLGGNVIVIGGRPTTNGTNTSSNLNNNLNKNSSSNNTNTSKPWVIGIQDPLKPDRGEVVAIIKAKDTSVVTSGSYERFFEEDGIRYHHIMDPFTGYPAENGIISSTIITSNSTDADALSTAVYVLGKEKALELIESLPNVEAVIITDDKKVYTTSGVTDPIFELKSKEFIYEKSR